MFSIPYLGSIVRVPRLNVGLLSSSSKVSRLLSCLFGSAVVSCLLKFQGETSYIRVKRDDGGTGSRRSRTKSRYIWGFPHSQLGLYQHMYWLGWIFADVIIVVWAMSSLWYEVDRTQWKSDLYFGSWVLVGSTCCWKFRLSTLWITITFTILDPQVLSQIPDPALSFNLKQQKNWIFLLVTCCAYQAIKLFQVQKRLKKARIPMGNESPATDSSEWILMASVFSIRRSRSRSRSPKRGGRGSPTYSPVRRSASRSRSRSKS